MKNKNNTTSDNDSFECCICFRNSDKILWNTLKNKPATLNEWEQSSTPLTNDTFFLGPCCLHVYCVECLRKIALGFDNHPVGPKFSHIPCNPPFEGECFTLTGMLNYFTHNDIKKILSKEEFEWYSNHVERYQFPGYEVVKCPRPIYRDGDLTRCGAGILVSLEDIQSKDQGNVILFCDQNEQCNRKTCYHCLNLLSRFAKKCEFCITKDESNNPKSFNRYFYVVGKRKKDGKNVCYRNEELTVDIVLDQIKEIVIAEKVYVKCLECLVPLFKTEQCNTLSHCRIERCYCCGRSGIRSQSDLGDHWDTTGLKGCPRFDYSKYWNEIANCGFRCEENRCYSDELGDCNRHSHQQGIRNMHEERKKAQVYHAIRSLLPNIREKVLVEMWKDKKLRNYIPKVLSKDHRSFYPDTLFKHFGRSREFGDMFQQIDFEKPVQKKTTSYRDLFADLYKKYI
jgi:hypothetical protein